MNDNKHDRGKGAEPERWAVRPPAPNTAESRVADLLRAGDPDAGFDDAGRARVLRRLRLSTFAPRSGLPIRGVRWAVAIVVLLTSGGMIGAVTLGHWIPPLFRSNSAAPPATEAPRAPRPSRRDRAPRAAAEVAAPSAGVVATEPGAVTSDEAAPAPVEPAANASEPSGPAAAPVPSAVVRTPPVRPSPPSPAARRPLQLALRSPGASSVAESPAPPASASASSPAPTALAQESQLLGQAVARLRQQQDARGALVVLDQYRAQFPQGTLTREAAVARVDALLMLGREADALAALRGLSLTAHGREQELRVIRAELTAAGDCAAAVSDFDRILAQASPDALIERALHGRASCRARGGDASGAIADLDRYLLLFPHGRFTGEARRARAVLEGR